jgi:hypothetical protein
VANGPSEDRGKRVARNSEGRPRTPWCLCVSLGLARGKNAVDEGVTALDEGGNGDWACGSGWEIKDEREWTVCGSCRDGTLAGKVKRARGRGIGANVGLDPSTLLGVNDSRRGTRGQLVGGTVVGQLAGIFIPAEENHFSCRGGKSKSVPLKNNV